MTKILGLDLGTNSIGWAIVEKDGAHFSLVDKGVRIFAEGVKSEKGIESSRAAERTAYRSARKIKFRRKLRKYETLKVLSNNNMCPLSIEEVEAWRKSGFKKYPMNPEFLKWLRTDEDKSINPYLFRDLASKQKVALYDLGRSFYHIAQRRGFLSSRLDQSAEGIIDQHKPALLDIIDNTMNITELQIEINEYFEDRDLLERKNDLDEGEKKLKTLFNSFTKIIKESSVNFEKCKSQLVERLSKKEDLGVVKQKIGEISQSMKEGNFETLGQYFFSLYNKAKIRNQYTAREEHYLAEFEIICKTQNIEGINKHEKLPEKRYAGLAKDLYKAIFFQRPLKSQKGLIGKCSFEKSKTRCAISHPDFEEYRMWTYINTIKIQTPEDKILRFLTQAEKLKIIPKFLRKKDNFNFEDLAKELIPTGSKHQFYKSSGSSTVNYLFNYKSTDSVSGCVVSASLKNVLGEDWKMKGYSYKTKNGNGETVTRNVDYTDLWHLISVSTSDLYLQEFAKQNLKLDDKKSISFSKIRLKKDFASLSLTAINKILPYLREGLLYSHAVFMANIENIVDDHIWSNPEDRLFILNKIAAIIQNNTVENGKLEVINGLIRDCKIENCYYSIEAETSYKIDLEKKLGAFFKYNTIVDPREQEIITAELFPVFIEQLKKYEFHIVKRLDEKVLEFLDGQNDDGLVYCNSKNRLKKLYHPSDIEVFKKIIIKDGNGNEKVVLGSPLTSSIKNPMAMRALHQLRKVLNTLIFEGHIDKKTRIHIEMARELNDSNKRKGIQDYQRDLEKNNKEYIDEIKKDYKAAKGIDIEPTEDDVLRYKLWIEQDKKELYEDSYTNIGIAQIIGSDPDYDIEHTIPRSRSQDNSQMNKTLCSKHFNRVIKRNKMPVELINYDDILSRIQPWKKKFQGLEDEIKNLSRAIKNATTKEQKDRKIRLRHKLNLQKEYFKGKYERFTYQEPKVGFKNSQIPDTGIITKYSQAYLKSYFNRVESVKGGMVAEFRKAWGIQESYIENGKKYYKVKDRSKHTHHCIDAITIACMTKDKYDVMAHAWALEDDTDKSQYKLMRTVLENSKPWATFTEDLKNLENQILISHHTPDNVKKQSKKIIRIRGKKQYVAEIERDLNGKAILKKDIKGQIIYKLGIDGNKLPRFQQGDTVRGSLHQDSIYGAIKDPLNDTEIRFVIRKDLESIKASDVECIVDEVVKEKVKQAIVNKVLLLSSNAQQKNKLIDKVWMNEDKRIEIKKVRLFANSVKNPLEIKEHNSLSRSRHAHKQKVYGQNDENFALAIFEGVDKKNKLKRTFECINNMDAGAYFKLSNKDFNQNYNIVPDPDDKLGLPLKYILRKGLMVIFYKDSPKEIYDLKHDDIFKRLYKLSKFDAQGRLTFRTHFEARQATELNEVYSIDFEKPFEQIRLQVSKLNMLVQGYEFELSPSGKINLK
jgi:CRISPR-associated endonuclease Csn1